VADIVPGSGGSFLRNVATTARGTLLAFDNRGAEPNPPWTGSLWTTTTTPTAAGETTMLQSSPLLSVDAVRFGDDALVHQSDFDVVGSQLWRTDGTAAGTRLVRGGFILSGGTAPAGPRAFFLDAQNPLMVTDGTSEGTRRVRGWPDNRFGSTTLHSLTVARGLAFFTVDSVDAVGTELWVSDGTRRGTRLLEDIRRGPRSASPSSLTVRGGRLFFVADDGRHGEEVWRSNRAGTGARRVTDLPATLVRNLTVCRDRLWFTTTTKSGATLWSSSGRAGSQRRVAALPGHPDRQPLELTCLPGGLAFTADDRVHGREPWSLAQGSRRPVLHDIRSGPRSSRPQRLTRAGEVVFLGAYEDVHGREVWTLRF
jgi:ELWxxDGT repeat protein